MGTAGSAERSRTFWDDVTSGTEYSLFAQEPEVFPLVTPSNRKHMTEMRIFNDGKRRKKGRRQATFFLVLPAAQLSSSVGRGNSWSQLPTEQLSRQSTAQLGLGGHISRCYRVMRS